MTRNDLQMVSGTKKSFTTANNAVNKLIESLNAIRTKAEGRDTENLTDESLKEAELTRYHLQKAENLINGKLEEPTLTYLFMEVKESLYILKERVFDELASMDVNLENKIRYCELDGAKQLISDVVAILDKAELMAGGNINGCKNTRVVLQAMGEYFTVDHTTPELRYTGIPEEYRK